MFNTRQQYHQCYEADRYCRGENLVVCTSRFQHLDVYKHTWLWSDRSTTNQINHIVIDRRHVSNVLNVRAFRGPNVDSDYYLVTTKVRLRISASRLVQSCALQKLNAKKLQSKRTADPNSSSMALVDGRRASPTPYLLLQKLFLVSKAHLNEINRILRKWIRHFSKLLQGNNDNNSNNDIADLPPPSHD